MVTLGEQFVATVESGDTDRIHAVFAPGASACWNVMTAEPFGVDELVAIRRAEQQVAPDLQFADLRITATTDGFVVQMVAAGTVEGVEVRVPHVSWHGWPADW